MIEILKFLNIFETKYLIRILILKSICLFILIFTFTNALAEEEMKIKKLEEWKENEWILESIIEDSVYVSVNGNITYEDRLRIRFLKGNCNLPNMLTSFYTMIRPREELVLEGKMLNAKFFNPTFFNYRMRVKVIQETPFHVGKSFLIDLGFCR
jgi:hypothetical protein